MQTSNLDLAIIHLHCLNLPWSHISTYSANISASTARHSHSFIQRHIFQKSKFLLNKAYVLLPSKTTFADQTTDQLIIKISALHSDTETELKVTLHSGVRILMWQHMRVECIIDTVAIELCFVSKQVVTMQPAMAIEPRVKFQPLGQTARSEMLTQHVVRIRTHYEMFSILSFRWTGGRHSILPVLARGLHSTIWTMLSSSTTYRSSLSAVMRTLGKCTGISQSVVNSSKHYSGWYPTVRNTSLELSYGMNCITVTKTICTYTAIENV